MELFNSTDPGDIIDELQKSDAGRAFNASFDSYLDEFGWRTDLFEVEVPTWIENPEVPLNTLQGYISLGDDSNPEIKYQEAVAVREELLAIRRRWVSSTPCMEWHATTWQSLKITTSG